MARSRNNRQLSKSENLVRSWLLRLLVPLGLHRKFFGRTGVSDDALASALGLDAWLDLDPDKYDPATLLVELRRLHAQAERSACSTRPPKLLSANVERLAKLVGLGDTDQRLLEFAILIHSDPVLDKSADGLGVADQRPRGAMSCGIAESSRTNVAGLDRGEGVGWRTSRQTRRTSGVRTPLEESNLCVLPYRRRQYCRGKLTT